ncbi:substrate binding domain-containing protein [Methylobacterium oryzae CBMB20]
MPLLPRFLAEHPDLDIEIVLDDRVIDLVGEGIDLSLRMGTLPDLGRRRPQASPPGAVLVLATPAYLDRAGELRSPADLAGHEAVVYSRQPDAWSFTRDGAEVSVAVHGRVRVSAAEGLRAAVLADIGLTIASDWMFAPELASGAVRRLLQPWALPEIDLWAVFPTGRMASAKARRFADFVQAAMAGTREAHSAAA